MNAQADLGDADDPGFDGRMHHHVDIGWGDAGKHRQVVTTDTGLQIRIALPRGSFLRAGEVIADDGESIVVVRRPAEPAITARFDDHADAAGARRMLLLGYLLGNQHAPIDVSDSDVAAPLFTSEQAAAELLTDLGIIGTVAPVPLAPLGWSRTSSSTHAGHHH
ncbi:urease accessory protein UreE [Mycobacterium sp. PSTR-4-N]|uniref:urease accessory protein UreE n=1 Tax=Mycobacterium sp. PSTR-4-N TaxID=2917745 RepID=UPI001F14A469|nr:urease accessory protein UreE [Mycobacterium sp. PSTR-4-N]MCG7593227.1 urease accessory protein UreE [Mycobacterium sp. PSTR-4-N]